MNTLKKISEIFIKFLKEDFSINDVRDIHKKINNEEILSSNTDQSTLIHKAIYKEFWESISSRNIEYIQCTEFKILDIINYLRIEPYLNSPIHMNLIECMIRQKFEDIKCII